VIQPDGKILVGGYGPDPDASSDITLVRYLSSIDVADAFDVLASSFEMLSPSQPALRNLLKQAARHVDREQWRPAIQKLSILQKRVRQEVDMKGCQAFNFQFSFSSLVGRN